MVWVVDFGVAIYYKNFQCNCMLSTRQNQAHARNSFTTPQQGNQKGNVELTGNSTPREGRERKN
jgi:hypothetical protein